MRNKKTILLLTLLPLLMVCKTTLPTVAQELTPAQIFQKAQEASDDQKYALAMYYYRTFQERYPDELERNLWAEYEIALLYAKLGKRELAITHFNSLLQRYATDAEAASYPPAPKILAEKVKARLEKTRTPAPAP